VAFVPNGEYHEDHLLSALGWALCLIVTNSKKDTLGFNLSVGILNLQELSGPTLTPFLLKIRLLPVTSIKVPAHSKYSINIKYSEYSTNWCVLRAPYKWNVCIIQMLPCWNVKLAVGNETSPGWNGAPPVITGPEWLVHRDIPPLVPMNNGKGRNILKCFHFHSFHVVTLKIEAWIRSFCSWHGIILHQGDVAGVLAQEETPCFTVLSISFLLYLFFFCGPGDWTQDLVHTLRQALYHLIHTPEFYF
jgi:hypothetical protein